MNKISTLWQQLRQIDEQAGAFNPWYNFANQCFDMVAQRHQRDWKMIAVRIRKIKKLR